MAKRRMIKGDILCTSEFLSLSRSAQYLYILACVNTDDEGVVYMYPLLRTYGIRRPAYAELIEKGYVLELPKCDMTVYVVDHARHNHIRPEHVETSIYHEQLVELLQGMGVLNIPESIEEKAVSADNSKNENAEESAEATYIRKCNKEITEGIRRYLESKAANGTTPDCTVSVSPIDADIGSKNRRRGVINSDKPPYT